MGGIQSKKDFIKRNEERISQLEHSMKVLDDNLKSTNTEENNIYREGISQFPDRISQLEHSMKVLDDNLKSTNTDLQSVKHKVTYDNLKSTNTSEPIRMEKSLNY